MQLDVVVLEGIIQKDPKGGVSEQVDSDAASADKSNGAPACESDDANAPFNQGAAELVYLAHIVPANCVAAPQKRWVRRLRSSVSSPRTRRTGAAKRRDEYGRQHSTIGGHFDTANTALYTSETVRLQKDHSKS